MKESPGVATGDPCGFGTDSGFSAGAPVSRHDFLPTLTIRFSMLMHIDLRSS
jgi:hypothetical protein